MEKKIYIIIQKKEHRLGWEIIFTILVAALFLSIYTFILQNNYKKEFY